MRLRRPRFAGAVLLAVALAATGCSSGAAQKGHAGGARASSTTAAPRSAASGPTTSNPSAGGAGGAGGAEAPAALSWKACGTGFQCAELAVPLDYAHPHGATIELALIRLPATNPSQRVGSLLVNPGGPGASGIQFVRQQKSLFSPSLRAHFDIVGFDPRGVGQSDPVRCENGQALTSYIDLNPAPTGEAGVKALVTASKEFARDCTAKSGKALLANVGTVDAARDMDRIRAALGDPKLNYLGFSYGTLLGATYAELFPTHVRAMVLDGAIDPALSTQAMDLQQAKGFELDLHDFLDQCRSDSSCPLNQEPGGPEAAFDRVLARIRSGPPLPTGGTRTLHAGQGYLGIIAALYSSSTWPVLAQGLEQALHGNGQILLALSDAYTQRRPNGTYSNELASNTAINCVDRPSPTSLSTYQADAASFAKVAPDFGELEAYSPLTCAYWPVRPTDHPHPIHAKGAPPIVVVGTTGDPATPYSWAQALAHQLSSGVLLTHVGVGHTAYGDSACVRRVVDAYLASLRVPQPGQVCHG